MLRLLGYFLIVFVAMSALRYVPVIGGLFRGVLGFYLVAILLSVAIAKWTAGAVDR